MKKLATFFFCFQTHLKFKLDLTGFLRLSIDALWTTSMAQGSYIFRNVSGNYNYYFPKSLNAIFYSYVFIGLVMDDHKEMNQRKCSRFTI